MTPVFFRGLLAAALFFACRPADAQPLRMDVTPEGLPANGASLNPVVSADGRYVAFVSAATNLAAGPTSNVWHIYRFDRVTGTLARAATRPRLVEDFPRMTAISHDGRLVLFGSFHDGWIPIRTAGPTPKSCRPGRTRAGTTRACSPRAPATRSSGRGSTCSPPVRQPPTSGCASCVTAAAHPPGRWSSHRVRIARSKPAGSTGSPVDPSPPWSSPTSRSR